MSKPKFVSVVGKVSDRCFTQLLDENKKVIATHDGYVPALIPGGYGDYIELEIDIETGQILNWVKPTKELLDLFIEKGQ